MNIPFEKFKAQKRIYTKLSPNFGLILQISSGGNHHQYLTICDALHI